MSESFGFHKDDAADREGLRTGIGELFLKMEEIYDSGYYPKLVVERSWSEHNPVIDGEFAYPRAFRWFLLRELKKLAEKGAQIQVSRSRKRRSLNDVDLLRSIDEDDWDFTQKKLFLFRPERIELSLDRLVHYTGTKPEDFQRYIIFTNYDMHMKVFAKRFPGCVKPERSVQMPAYHHKLHHHLGITLINIGVGPSNAKTATDHIAVLRPDALIMAGHCGGLRNHQEVGDFVLASGYMRGDQILDNMVPQNVPIAPTSILNNCLREALESFGMNYRFGTVYTTANRNWEFSLKKTLSDIHISRSIAIDMESATVATNGFRYRIPNATLLSVSDKPLHGKPKLSKASQQFYKRSKEKHLEIVIHAIDLTKAAYPDGMPNAHIRSFDEPLMGGY